MMVKPAGKSWHYQDPLEISKGEWIELFCHKDIFDDITMQLIEFVYNQPGHQSTVFDICNKSGFFVSYSHVTAKNRTLSKALYRHFDKEPLLNETGGRRYFNVMFDGVPEHEFDDFGHFIWRLRPELINALEEKLGK